MHAEAARLGHGIDQPRERRASAATEIVALGIIDVGDVLGRHAGDCTGHRWRRQARRIDEQPALQRHRVFATDLDLEAVLYDAGAQQRRMKGERAARVLDLAAHGQHESVAVDNAGGGRQQGAGAAQGGLQRLRFGGGQHLHAFHAVGFGMSLDRYQLLVFGRAGGDDQLSAAPVWYAVVVAVGVEHAPPRNAHPRHQASGGIIDPGVDHLAVAR